MLKIGHVVVRPGRRHGDAPVEIPVPEELENRARHPHEQEGHRLL